MVKQQRRLAVVIVGLLAGSLILLKLLMPDQTPNIIQRELERRGCDVEGVEFVLVEKIAQKRAWIYRSSEPVLYDGLPVEFWVYRYATSYGWPMITYDVAPYRAQ